MTEESLHCSYSRIIALCKNNKTKIPPPAAIGMTEGQSGENAIPRCVRNDILFNLISETKTTPDYGCGLFSGLFLCYSQLALFSSHHLSKPGSFGERVGFMWDRTDVDVSALKGVIARTSTVAPR